MELRDGMFAVKLCELEHQYGLLRSRLELCQGADHEKIRHLLADVLDDYRENALLLEQSAEGCRSPAVAELAGVQRDYSKRMEELLRNIQEAFHLCGRKNEQFPLDFMKIKRIMQSTNR